MIRVSHFDVIVVVIIVIIMAHRSIRISNGFLNGQGCRPLRASLGQFGQLIHGDGVLVLQNHVPAQNGAAMPFGTGAPFQATGQVVDGHHGCQDRAFSGRWCRCRRRRAMRMIQSTVSVVVRTGLLSSGCCCCSLQNHTVLFWLMLSVAFSLFVGAFSPTIFSRATIPVRGSPRFAAIHHSTTGTLCCWCCSNHAVDWLRSVQSSIRNSNVGIRCSSDTGILGKYCQYQWFYYGSLWNNALVGRLLLLDAVSVLLLLDESDFLQLMAQFPRVVPKALDFFVSIPQQFRRVNQIQWRGR